MLRENFGLQLVPRFPPVPAYFELERWGGCVWPSRSCCSGCPSNSGVFVWALEWEFLQHRDLAVQLLCPFWLYKELPQDKPFPSRVSQRSAFLQELVKGGFKARAQAVQFFSPSSLACRRTKWSFCLLEARDHSFASKFKKREKLLQFLEQYIKDNFLSDCLCVFLIRGAGWVTGGLVNMFV